MSEIKTFSIPQTSLLWWTRGKNWDREIVSFPGELVTSNWNELFSKVFSRSLKAPEKSLQVGQLHCSNGMSFFIYSSFESHEAKDWTNRPIPHYLVFFDFVSKSEKEFQALWGGLPVDWGRIVEKSLLTGYYNSSLFLLSDDEVRSWRDTQPEPFYIHVNRNFMEFLPKVIDIPRDTLGSWPEAVDVILIEGISLKSREPTVSVAAPCPSIHEKPVQKTLAEKVRGIIEETCQNVASFSQQELRRNRSENLGRIVSILALAFNARESDSFIQHWAEKTLAMQSLLGIAQWGGKKVASKIPYVKEYLEEPDFRGIGIEKCAACLSEDEAFYSRSFSSEDEGLLFISHLLPESSVEDTVVKALFFRSEKLIKNGKTGGITSGSSGN